jgi:hypothetical protein
VAARDPAARLAALVATCEADPARLAASRLAGDKLAAEAGGEVALRWRLTVLRAAMASPPDDDAVRELYGELCDRYRDDPKSLAIIKPLGDEIRRLEAAGALPSTLVARSDRRKKI